MKFGQFEIKSFVERKFRLDGGQMFGVIPKTMWQKLIPADENNLIPMVTNLFVLKARGKTMMFDGGLGDSLNEREEKIYAVESASMMDSGLAGIGLTPDDIDVVILTHLHTDHAGGIAKLVDGKFVPRFANARHIIDKTEWDRAINPDERTGAVYLPERYRPIEEAGLVDFIDGETELFPGVRAVPTGGHSEGHFALEIESEGKQVFYYADIFATSAHMGVAYVPATDLFPLDTMAVKRRVLPRIIEENVVMAYDHDVNIPLGRVRQEGRKYVVTPVEG